jgi:hypothetical protein
MYNSGLLIIWSVEESDACSEGFRDFPQSLKANVEVEPKIRLRLLSSRSSVLLTRLSGPRSRPTFFFPLALQPQFGPWPTSMKLSVSLQFTRS